MRKSHVIVVAVLVAAGAAIGALALARTTELGVKARGDSKKSADAVVAARTKQLDALERSLQKALAKKPPKLPPLPKAQAQTQPAPPVSAAPAPGSSRVAAAPAPARTQSARYSEHEHEHSGGGEHDD